MRKRLRCGFLVMLTVATISARPACAQSDAPIAPMSPEPAPPFGQEALLRPGQVVTLRIRQVIPRDGLSPGDRVLNGLPTHRPGRSGACRGRSRRDRIPLPWSAGPWCRSRRRVGSASRAR